VERELYESNGIKELIVRVSDGDPEDIIVSEMMSNNYIPSLISPKCCVKKDMKEFHYNVTDLKAFDKVMQSRIVCIDFINMLLELCEALVRIDSYLIPMNSILWNTESVFFDQVGKAKLICIPIRNEAKGSNFNWFLSRLIDQVIIREEEYQQVSASIRQLLRSTTAVDVRVLGRLLLKEKEYVLSGKNTSTEVLEKGRMQSEEGNKPKLALVKQEEDRSQAPTETGYDTEVLNLKMLMSEEEELRKGMPQKEGQDNRKNNGKGFWGWFRRNE